MTNQNPDVWDLKWRKEGFTFPFGSLMSAYSQIKAGELVGKDTKFDLGQFKKDSYDLYLLARKMVNETADENESKLKKTASPDEVDILTD